MRCLAEKVLFFLLGYALAITTSLLVENLTSSVIQLPAVDIDSSSAYEGYADADISYINVCEGVK